MTLLAGHNYFDTLPRNAFGDWNWLWKILKSGDFVKLGEHTTLAPGYPVLPWLGVMATGYGFGTVWQLDPERRRRWLVVLGITVTSMFVLIRWINIYGDPRPWEAQSDPWLTFLSFLNCWKYPPSLLYVLMTLGPAILLLAWFDRGPPGRLSRPLVVFGRVPLFYYLLHLPLIHGLAVLAGFVDGWGLLQIKAFCHHPSYFPFGSGYNLIVVYLVWILVLLLLYPPCVWFADLKRRRSDWWLSYL
jgi:uncharacterized membrane protein